MNSRFSIGMRNEIVFESVRFNSMRKVPFEFMSEIYSGF